MVGIESETIEISPAEVARYLGYKDASPDEKVSSAISRAIETVTRVSEPRSVYRAFPLDLNGDPDIYIGSLHIKSSDLAKNLSGCGEAYLFGATAGIGIDRLIAKASVSGVSDAAIYQAAGAAYIESYCDMISGRIKKLAEEEHKKTKPRFSPGFGDFTIDYQPEIFRVLDLTRQIGASLTDGLLMMPSKTVTAVIGTYKGTL